MTEKFNFNSEQIDQIVVKHILPLISKYTIFTFTGPLGAGKTTLIRSILRQCGIDKTITSPTFGYVNSYMGKKDLTFNHFDLYRIGSIDEFINFGFDEYLAKKNSINFIEWPEVIKSLLESPEYKSKVCKIKIDYITNDKSNEIALASFDPSSGSGLPPSPRLWRTGRTSALSNDTASREIEIESLK